MKHLFTLLAFMMLGCMVQAQNSYVFSDKDGNVIENGATIERTEVEDDGFGSIMIKSGLYVKNNNAPEGYQVAVEANITRIDNGAVQLCFPTNCHNATAVGPVVPNGKEEKTTLAQGAVKDIVSEWLPTTYGECIVEYIAKSYTSIFVKDEYKVTIHYKYAQSAGIEQTKSSQTAGVSACYDLLGRQMTAAQRGVTIVRMSDGSVHKVYR